MENNERCVEPETAFCIALLRSQFSCESLSTRPLKFPSILPASLDPGMSHAHSSQFHPDSRFVHDTGVRSRTGLL